MKDFYIEKCLQNYKAFITLVPIGEENAITKWNLYLTYIEGLKSYDEDYKTGKKKIVKQKTFERVTRSLCAKAREAGVLLVNGNAGIFICKDDKELNYYINREMKKVTSYLEQFSALKRKKITEFIRENYFQKKQKPDLSQLRFDDSLFKDVV